MTHNAHAPHLFETPRGSVLHCACCGRVQVQFADVTLLMDADYLRALERKLGEATAQLDAAPTRQWFRLSINADAGARAVPLRAGEALELRRLASGARAMLQLKERLDGQALQLPYQRDPLAASPWPQ